MQRLYLTSILFLHFQHCFFIAVHDTCDENALSQDAEEGLHDFEVPCQEMGCNVIDSDGDPDAQLICQQTGTTSAAAAKGGLVAIMVALAAVVMK